MCVCLTQVRFKREGSEGFNAERGDLVFEFDVVPHPTFSLGRDGTLFTTLNITLVVRGPGLSRFVFFVSKLHATHTPHFRPGKCVVWSWCSLA